MIEQLQSYLQSFGILNSSEIDLMLGEYQLVIVERDKMLLEIGNVCSRMGFITEGVARMFCLNGAGDEITKHFIKEGEFAVDIESFNHQKKSANYISAVTPCKMLVVSKTSLDKLAVQIPNW